MSLRQKIERMKTAGLLTKAGLATAGVVAAAALVTSTLNKEEYAHTDAVNVVDDEFHAPHDNDVYVVKLQPGASIEDVDILRDSSYGITAHQLHSSTPDTFVFDAPPEWENSIYELVNLTELDSSDVADAFPNYWFQNPANETSRRTYSAKELGISGDFPNDPLYQEGLLWGMDSIHMQEAWSFLQEKMDAGWEPVRPAQLAIIDTGAYPDHEDLEYNIVRSFVPGDDGMDQEGYAGHPHGPHCAGTSAGLTNNGKGVASPAFNGLVVLNSYKVLAADGRGSYVWIAQAMRQAADDGMDAVNMSLGGGGDKESDKLFQEAIQYAVGKGTMVYVAAGNNNWDHRRTRPSRFEETISSAACWVDGKQVKRAPYSNHGADNKGGPGVDVCAPGGNTRFNQRNGILSSVDNNRYAFYQGTSMASPHTAGVGVVAQLIVDFEKGGDYKWMRNLLRSTSDDVVKKERRKPVGGYLNAEALWKTAWDQRK